jgi:hypothetical protein
MSTKDKALQVINSHQGKSLVYARREEISEISPQYEPIVTAIEYSPDDFDNLGGNMYLAKSGLNRLSEASGISYTENCGTRESGSFREVEVEFDTQGQFWYAKGSFAIIGWAQGVRIKPDGTERRSSVNEYEFNVVDRANEQFLKDADGNKYISSKIKAMKKLTEIKKFATQRAKTGAQLGVVRELAAVPTAFKPNQLQQSNHTIVVSQVVESSQYKADIARELMKTPDGRQAVASAVFGNTAKLYGQNAVEDQRVVSPDIDDDPIIGSAEIVEDHETDEFGDFEDTPAENQTQENNERDRKIVVLEQYLNSGILSPKGCAVVSKALKEIDSQSDEQLDDLIKRCKDQEAKR